MNQMELEGNKKIGVYMKALIRIELQMDMVE